MFQKRERLASKRMKRFLGELKGNGLTKAMVTEEDGTIIEFNTKESIEMRCHAENKKKFSQTNHTPAIQGKLVEELGFG